MFMCNTLEDKVFVWADGHFSIVSKVTLIQVAKRFFLPPTARKEQESLSRYYRIWFKYDDIHMWYSPNTTRSLFHIRSISKREMGPLVILANPGVHIHPGYCAVPYWGYDPNAYSKNRNGELSYVGMIHYSCTISRFDQCPYFISENYFMSGAYPQGKWKHFILA